MINGLQKTINDNITPIDERIYCLTLLDMESAIPFAQKMLDNLVSNSTEVTQGPKHVFHLLWNAYIALPGTNQISLQTGTMKVISQWELLQKNVNETLYLLALSGLCAFLSNNVPPKVVTPIFEEGESLDSEFHKPISLICALYAVAYGAIQDDDKRSLKTLIDVMQDPPHNFHRRWHLLLPRARREALSILGNATITLYGNSDTKDLACALVFEIASKKFDDIFDDNILLRINLVFRILGKEKACELIIRRENKWEHDVQYLPKPVLNQFINLISQLMENHPETKSKIMNYFKRLL